MKLVILRENFLNALNSAEKAVGSASHLPILKSVLVEADSKIIVTSTNLEFGVRCTLPGKIVERGAAAVPFSLLAGIVRNIGSERITLETKESKIIISAENYEASVQGQNTKEFPIIPAIHDKDHSLTLSLGNFRGAFEKVVHAAQFSDIRPEISGVFIRYFDGALVCVATDSFRLAEYVFRENQFETNFREISAIVPLKTIQELLKIFSGDNEAALKIFIDPSQILFATDTQEVVSRLIDGTFPDYSAIIPRESAQEITVRGAELISALKLVSTFSGRAQDVVLGTGDNKKLLELYCGDSSVGENRHRVPAKLKGEKFSIAFNWRYLFDGLKICGGDEVTIGLNGAQKPAIIRCAQEPSLLYVVMPIKG